MSKATFRLKHLNSYIREIVRHNNEPNIEKIMLKSCLSLLFLTLAFSLVRASEVVNVTLSPYGTIRRVVTGTTYDGNSTVLEDKRLTAYDNVTIAQTSLFWTDTIPYNSTAGPFVDLAPQHPEDIQSNNGTHFFALDFGPGTSYVSSDRNY